MLSRGRTSLFGERSGGTILAHFPLSGGQGALSLGRIQRVSGWSFFELGGRNGVQVFARNDSHFVQLLHSREVYFFPTGLFGRFGGLLPLRGGRLLFSLF